MWLLGTHAPITVFTLYLTFNNYYINNELFFLNISYALKP